jgi:SRSO17 transposase
MDDPERCRAAGIPAEREFATKAQIARGVPARLVDAGVPARWIAADEAYGQDYRFRRAIELLGESSWYPVRADASSNPDS